MDLSKTPCTAASLAYLASKGFYDNTACHRLVDGIFALQCGDPSGTGSGGATYRFDDENLPTGKLPAYHDGDVAMANTGQPGSNGSQFFFVYGTISQLQAELQPLGQGRSRASTWSRRSRPAATTARTPRRAGGGASQDRRSPSPP